MSSASSVLKTAAAELGYCRWDDNQAGTKYGRWYAKETGSSYFGQSGVPFCAMFVSYILDKCGVKATGLPTASCSTIVSGAKKAGRWVSGHKGIKIGDLALYDWNGNGVPDHVGIVEKVYSSYIQAIEGNTTGSDGRSGSVARRTRTFGYILGYYSMDYDGTGTTATKPSSSGSTLDLGDTTIWGRKFNKTLQTQLDTSIDGIMSGQAKSDQKYFWKHDSDCVTYSSKATGSDMVQALQEKLINAGYSCGSAGADRCYGKGTITAHQKWLKKKGYYTGTVDGYNGPETNQAVAKALKAKAYTKL